MRLPIFLLLLLALPLAAQKSDEPITRIAAGSCFKPERDKNDIWEVIARTDPQFFLFMGDNIYGDTEDMAVLTQKYDALLDDPGYAEFNKKFTIFPAWDDHDYGANDAGENYPKRVESQKIFQDTFNFPPDHPARKTPGTYYSETFGPEGKRLHLIVLDTRYFRSDLKAGFEKIRKSWVPDPDPNKTILGEAQWKWLEAELRKPADLRIIVSSIQIITTEHRFEKWENLPLEREKFLKLLAETKPGPLVILSGDRHCGEIAKLPAADTGLPYDLFEMTTSGLTHAGAPEDPNKFRVGPFTNDINFGTLDLDWSKPAPQITLNLHDHEGKVINEQVLEF